jgi:flagellar FliL protein
MQDLLNSLSTPILIGLIVLFALVLVGLVLLARRRRTQSGTTEDDTAINYGSTTDYTSLPLDEEPQGWRDRFARLSLPGKILAFLVPILAVLGLFVAALALLPSSPPPPPPATAVPVTLTITKADLIRIDPIQSVRVTGETTGVANDTPVRIELLEDGQPFSWFDPEGTSGAISRNQFDMTARRAEGASQPTQGRQYTIRVSVGEGEGLMQQDTPLIVPSLADYQNAFFGSGQQAAAPTPTRPAPSPTTGGPTATAAPSATPVPALPEGVPTNVLNGGNVRKQPIIADNVVGGVNAGETVQLIERTPNGAWYRVRTIRDELGWVSTTLLQVDAALAGQVPIASVVTVFGNGPLFEAADAAATQLDRVNVEETVELLEKTAASDWYRVRNVRDVEGWVQASLLGIPPEIAAQVPVAGSSGGGVSAAATPTGAATSAPTGLSAQVAIGGNIRREPLVSDDNVVGNIDAGETVELLNRSPDSLWFRIRSDESIEGWVSVSLLTFADGVAEQVPVAE